MFNGINVAREICFNPPTSFWKGFHSHLVKSLPRKSWNLKRKLSRPREISICLIDSHHAVSCDWCMRANWSMCSAQSYQKRATNSIEPNITTNCEASLWSCARQTVIWSEQNPQNHRNHNSENYFISGERCFVRKVRIMLWAHKTETKSQQKLHESSFHE